MSDFLQTIPRRLLATVHTISSDMWDAYLGAATDLLSANPEVEARVVIDRFHVAQNYRAAFDQLRKQTWRRLRKELSEAAYQQHVKGMHWVLRHNHANLEDDDKVRLRRLLQLAPRLHQAYSLREELTALFNSDLSIASGQRRLRSWMRKVKRSTVRCFDKFLTTMRNHFDMIVNYFDHRANSGFVEGINNKLKIITRRSYGLKRVDSLFRRLWLDIHGYKHFIA